MNSLRLFGVLLAAAIVTAASAAAAAPDPYQIFSNARAYWLTQHYPQKLEYAVAVDIVEGGRERVEHYSTQYDATNGTVSVDPVSDYQLEHP